MNHKPRINRLRRKNEGYTAYQYGITVNPYERMTADRENWWKGWEEAQQEDIQNHEEEWR